MIEVLVASLLLGATSPQDESLLMGSRLRQEPTQVNLRLGSCSSGERRIDMQRVMFLENRTLLTSESQPRLIEVRRETATIEMEDREGALTTSYVPIDALIDDEADLDLELKLVVFEGEVMVFWKETFQNRIYRQGLVKLIGQDFVPVCEGQGGSEVSH